ncbi:hypothetical protein NADE_004987 [Nannochloris sp. 'desiccata']|nr:hypothetical protein NADE_004987 [Chlorella desiccata (nom. nud.)]
MFPGRVPPPFRTASAASGDFDPESPRRNSQTGEFGPTPVNTFAPPPTAIQHNPLFNNAPGGHPPSRLPPPPQRAGRGGSQELPATGSGFQRPSGLQQPGFLAGLPMPSVPRTSSWAIKGLNEGSMGGTSLGGGIGGQSRSISNVPSPSLLSPTQGNLMMASNDESPSAVIQVSQPNVGMPYAPQRGGSGSPRMMQAAQQYAAAFQQQINHQEMHYEQQQYTEQQQQINHQEMHYEQQQYTGQQQQINHQEMHCEQQQYTGQQQMQNPAASDAGEWLQQPEPERAQIYGNSGSNEEIQIRNEEGGYEGQGYDAPGIVPEMTDPSQQFNGEQYNEQSQYYDNQQYNQEQLYGVNVAYDGNGVDGPESQSQKAYAASRKLPPPAVSFDSPIKAKFARGSAHSSARAGALAGAFNKAEMTTGLPQLPPPPPLQPPQGLPQMSTGGGDGHGYNTGAVMDKNQSMMHGFPSGGFAGSSVASVPAGEEGSGGNDGQVEQQEEEASITAAEAPLPPLPPPPPMMGAPGGMVGAGGFPTFGSKPVLGRKDSAQSQPGSARSNGNGPPQFGTLSSAGSGIIMAGNKNTNNNNVLTSRGSMDGVSGHQMGVYQPSAMMPPPLPGSPRSGGRGSGGGGDLGKSSSSSKLDQPQQQKDSRNKPRKQRRRGICSVLFIITLVLTLSAALSVGTTIVAVTFAANMTHAAIAGLGSIAHGASLSSAIARMHPAAVGIAKHVDEVSQAQWLATENAFKCDDSKPTCRGTRWVFHSARLGGILAKDGAIYTASHAPRAIKQITVPTARFTQQQSALLFDQLKGMKTHEGRDAVVAAVHQSAGEVKKLGRDLYVWAHCVYQHLSQSGVHSIHHVVEPVAGCWVETMGHYYLPDDGGDTSGSKGDSIDVAAQEKKEEEEEASAGMEVDEVQQKATEAEERESAAPIENIGTENEEVVIVKEPVEEQEEEVMMPEAVVEEKIEDEQKQDPSPIASASSPTLLDIEAEAKEEKHEDVEIEVDDQEINSAVTAELINSAVGVPAPVETKEIEEEEEGEEVHLPATNAANVTTTEVSPEIEIKEEVPEHYENVVEIEEEEEQEKENNDVEVQEHVVEEVKEVPPLPPPVVLDFGAEQKVEAEQEQQQQEEESVTPEAPEVVVVDTSTATSTPTSTPSSGLPERYASEDEYMIGHGEPAADERGEEEEAAASSGSGGDVKDEVTDQGSPGPSTTIGQTTTGKQSTLKKPLWSVLAAQSRELKDKFVSAIDSAVDSLRPHQASVLAALGAAGGTAVLFFAANALAARKAALAARLAAGAGAQQLTPRRPSSAAEEAPATVFKSARSGRKTQTVVTTVDEERDGLLKKRSRQSAPARLAAPAFEQEEEAVEADEVEPRGRKSGSRGGASRGRSRSRGGAATTSRGRKATAEQGAAGASSRSRGGRKASVSRRPSTKATT